MKATKFLLFFLLWHLTLHAQMKNQADCETAQNLNVSQVGKTPPFPSPDGPGEIMEIQGGKNNKYAFEKEHHSSWFTFKGRDSLKLVFEIIPVRHADDYDFMLFETDENADACKLIQHKKIRAVRTNISKGDSVFRGRTGLNLNARNAYKEPGSGNPYSAFLELKKGKKYYLLIDRYNDSRNGFSLNLNFQQEVHIAGKIVDDANKPLHAEISISDKYGNEIHKSETDKNGNYSITEALTKNQNYTLVAFNDSSFIQSRILNTSDLQKESNVFQDITLVLPKLRKGKKFTVNNLNFEGGLDVLLTESIPVRHNLFKLMQKNKKLIIIIEGHVNGCDLSFGDPMLLSQKRAENIFFYLMQKGIEKQRMSTLWFGCSRMLYPNPKSAEEEKLNRRVEIKVIDY